MRALRSAVMLATCGLVSVVLTFVGLLFWIAGATSSGLTRWVYREHCKSNCLLFAWQQYLDRGGYFVMTRSHYWWGPHFFWMSEDGTSAEEFVPAARYPRWTPPMIFHGVTKVFDPRTREA